MSTRSRANPWWGPRRRPENCQPRVLDLLDSSRPGALVVLGDDLGAQTHAVLTRMSERYRPIVVLEGLNEVVSRAFSAQQIPLPEIMTEIVKVVPVMHEMWRAADPPSPLPSGNLLRRYDKRTTGSRPWRSRCATKTTGRMLQRY